MTSIDQTAIKLCSEPVSSRRGFLADRFNMSGEMSHCHRHAGARRHLTTIPTGYQYNAEYAEVERRRGLRDARRPY